MVQELTVKCPHCHQVADIYLSTNACVIILNCPTCTSPIMYFDQKIFVLTPHQLEAIKNKTHGSSMMNMLKNMVRSELQLPVEEKTVSSSYQEHHKLVHTPSVTQKCNVTSNDSKIHIGKDDIINMRIDLAMSRDVLEFINKV